ncbi:MAG: poly-gamma-glutamate system protein [Candidatus Marinimicrobia bacterium]|nr:poly-gamma-glutamate system protein [Candidatus Neomarinimicrobiota bacterium]MBT3937617.1 poly-gamma-glutamate system protein [Candidatus Neomarinimicrobiota bacterium]MBT3960676.1 poly-gamma-glutamate system protein [Candidatus Neomarinimicrobiota bacterium]MBT4382866.1 poly-gamma-glutamate system protein [Candidatus Neomarinimicrobiota bacterium]MBT4635066.1 poly-gamma-glutamate system protein [Candidatus Neomarinimicrobiota bacterium]
MSNYKKQPFIPMIQKTSTLVGLAVLSIACFTFSVNNKVIDVSPTYDLKVKAAQLMKKGMEELKQARMEKSIFVDLENDPNETGLVGSPFSLITTDEGDLDAKLTTLDPNFSAALVELYYRAGLKSGDTVAVLLTGSMPGGNIAALTACKTMGITPVTITSVGASQWGANHEDFTWLDMENILFQKSIISNRSIAASIGGRNDLGRLLSPKGRDLIRKNIADHELPIIHYNRLKNNIQERLKQFSSILPIKSYDAFINVGGGVASLGTSFNHKLLPPGVILRNHITDITRPGGIEGVLSHFAKQNVPVVHILNIKSLTESLNLPFAPIPIPDIGSGKLYANETYNLIITFLAFMVVAGAVVGVGFHSKKRIKEHLLQHEPDSLL